MLLHDPLGVHPIPAENPEKRVLLFLRSDLALEERILKISIKSAENAIFLRSDLRVQDRILKIRVLASLGKWRKKSHRQASLGGRFRYFFFFSVAGRGRGRRRPRRWPGTLVFFLFQKNPRVRKIRVRNSGAGNGCANFMDTWKKCVLSAGKPMSIKCRVLGEVLGGGEGVPILFLWTRGFSWLLKIEGRGKGAGGNSECLWGRRGRLNIFVRGRNAHQVLQARFLALSGVIRANRFARFARSGWFARIGNSSDLCESAWRAIKIGVQLRMIRNWTPIRANRVANRPCH